MSHSLSARPGPPRLARGSQGTIALCSPIIAGLPIALSTDEATVNAAVRQLLQVLLQGEAHAGMFTQAGWASAVGGDEAALAALARALVISGDEAKVRDRLQELLSGGLDELVLLPLPIVDEAAERQRLLHLIGSL